MSLVLDSSVTLAWAFPEVTTDPVRHVFGLVAAGGAWAPGMWRLEVGNILENGVRRRRHEAAFRDALLADLAQLPIQVDTETDRHAWSATMRLAVRHRLTAYDACYLELAQRLRLALATLDMPLRNAAVAEGVSPLGL